MNTRSIVKYTSCGIGIFALLGFILPALLSVRSTWAVLLGGLLTIATVTSLSVGLSLMVLELIKKLRSNK